MKRTATKNSLKTAMALVFALAVSSFAELAGMNDNTVAESGDNSTMSALVGLGGGNSMIADDGVIFMTLRIGVDVKQLFATGARGLPCRPDRLPPPVWQVRADARLRRR